MTSVGAAGGMAASLQRHEYTRSPAAIEVSKSTMHTLTKEEIYNILAPAMDVMGIRATARHEPLDLARKVLRKAPPASQTPEVELAVLTAQAQSERDVRHKSLLLPAVLALGLVHGPDDPKWSDMAPEAAVRKIPSLESRDLSNTSDLDDVFRAQQVADRLRREPIQVLVIVQCMYFSNAKSDCSTEDGSELRVWDRLFWVDNPRCLIGCASSLRLFGHFSCTSALLPQVCSPLVHLCVLQVQRNSDGQPRVQHEPAQCAQRTQGRRGLVAGTTTTTSTKGTTTATTTTTTTATTTTIALLLLLLLLPLLLLLLVVVVNVLLQEITVKVIYDIIRPDGSKINLRDLDDFGCGTLWMHFGCRYYYYYYYH